MSWEGQERGNFATTVLSVPAGSTISVTRGSPARSCCVYTLWLAAHSFPFLAPPETDMGTVLTRPEDASNVQFDSAVLVGSTTRCQALPNHEPSPATTYKEA